MRRTLHSPSPRHGTDDRQTTAVYIARTGHSPFRAAWRVVEHNHPQMGAMHLETDANSSTPGANRVRDQFARHDHRKFDGTFSCRRGQLRAQATRNEPPRTRRRRGICAPLTDLKFSAHDTAVWSKVTDMTSLPVTSKIHAPGHAGSR